MSSWIIDILVLLSLAAIALGRLRPLRINRAGIAFSAASSLLLLAWLLAKDKNAGLRHMEELLSAINAPTLLLLVSMMIFATNLSLSGFFNAAVQQLGRIKMSSAALLGWVMLVSGIFSALFINDTAVIMLSPLLIGLCKELDVDPRPQLLGLAMGTNTGSALTLVGNPQNILVAGMSGLNFGRYSLTMLLPVFFSLTIGWLCLFLAFRRSISFAATKIEKPLLAGKAFVYKPLMIKSLLSLAGFFIAVLAGMSAHLAALLAASALLITRRLAPEKVFRGVDWTLPVFFCGLFVITGAARETHLFSIMEALLMPIFQQGEYAQAAVITIFSQFISNVPTVMLLSPLLANGPNPALSWTLLAAISTMAANLTILGAVANLLTAEAARAKGIHLGFFDFLKAGLPSSIISIAATVFWLRLVC